MMLDRRHPSKVRSNFTRLNSIVLLSCLLTLGTTIHPIAALASYNPPSGGSAPSGPTTTTGRRGGCNGEATTNLTILAPKSHVGQTAASHPSFTWFVNQSESLPIEFYLYESDANQQRRLIHKAELDSQPGFMSFKLPADQAGLQPGSHYVWKVILLCNPNNPSSALVEEAEFERMDMPPTLTAALIAAKDPLETSQLYAESGFWYDAMAALQEAGASASVQQAELSLLEDLAELETAKGAANYGAQLKQVIAAEQSR